MDSLFIGFGEGIRVGEHGRGIEKKERNRETEREGGNGERNRNLCLQNSGQREKKGRELKTACIGRKGGIGSRQNLSIKGTWY